MKIIRDLTTVNFTHKASRDIRAIVIHSMWGTQRGSISWFKNPKAKASAHYCLSAKGEIVQTVLDKDIAWHAGVFDITLPDWLRPNPNWYTIGIELEDKRDRNWSYPEPQKKAFVWLVNHLCNKYKIPKDKEHLLLHKNLNPSKRSDPVGAFSLDWVLGEEENQVSLKDRIIDFDDPEGKRKKVDWYVREHGVEKERAENLLKELKTKDQELEGLQALLREKDNEWAGQLNDAVEKEQKKHLSALWDLKQQHKKELEQLKEELSKDEPPENREEVETMPEVEPMPKSDETGSLYPDWRRWGWRWFRGAMTTAIAEVLLLKPDWSDLKETVLTLAVAFLGGFIEALGKAVRDQFSGVPKSKLIHKIPV